MSPYAIVGIAALSLLVAGWLIVSFTAPSPRRAVIEWLSATALYGALCALFAHLCHRAWTEGSTFALVAFAFLLVIFVSGGIASLTNALLSLRGVAREQQSATS